MVESIIAVLDDTRPLPGSPEGVLLACKASFRVLASLAEDSEVPLEDLAKLNAAIAEAGAWFSDIRVRVHRGPGRPFHAVAINLLRAQAQRIVSDKDPRHKTTAGVEAKAIIDVLTLVKMGPEQKLPVTSCLSKVATYVDQARACREVSARAKALAEFFVGELTAAPEM
ncbi:MAG: hypothetical protein HY461_03095 [Parcubacteria group bacterium]|nr:hypothetical protein [Parcubacteria group bacterium]